MSVPTIPGERIDGEHLEYRRDQIRQLLHRPQRSRFPGAQPVSLCRAHIETELKQRDYYLCEKTDGIRCLLFFTTNPDGAETHYLIDREFDFYQISGLHFPHHEDPTFQRFHSNWLIDGELVNDTLPSGEKKMRFLVFDCLLRMGGEQITSRPLDKRLGIFKAFVFEPYKKLFYKEFPEELQYQPFEIKFKDQEFSYAISRMFNEKLPNLLHGNDGLVFTCKESAYVFGTDEKILKWKPAWENTIDFRLELGEFPMVDPGDDEGGLVPDWDAMPNMVLQVWQGQDHGGTGHTDFAALTLTPEEWEAFKALGEVIDGRILECYKDTSGHWRPKMDKVEGSAVEPRFRDDKSNANHSSTVQKVLQSIDDGVSKEELIAQEVSIRGAWKEREKRASMKRGMEDGGGESKRARNGD